MRTTVATPLRVATVVSNLFRISSAPMSPLTPGTPIALVGMMGCGKSTVGRRLAAALKRPFVDADKELEARCGVTIATIFASRDCAKARIASRCQSWRPVSTTTSPSGASKITVLPSGW